MFVPNGKEDTDASESSDALVFIYKPSGRHGDTKNSKKQNSRA